MYPALSKRLAVIAGMVRPGSVTADIGTDHGHLIVWLAASGRIPRGFACDINQKPLDKAVKAAGEAGVAHLVDCRLSDGLAALKGEKVDNIVIAGMGGELIARILEQSPFEEPAGQRYLLQPMTRPETLRRWLAGHGFDLEKEQCVEDGDFCYSVMQAAWTGKVWEPDDLWALTGRVGSCPGDDSPLYLRRLAGRLETQAAGMEKAGLDTGRLRRLLGEIGRKLDGLEENP